MQEEWRDIPDYNGYIVSNLGRVMSLKNRTGITRRILQSFKNHKGYCKVELWKNGKGERRMVHRLVASAFIPNPDNKPQIDHIDGNKENNCVNNLRWATSKENINNPNTQKGKPIICVETGIIYQSARDAWRYTGISYRHISDVLCGRRKKTGGFHWSFVK